MGEIRLRVRGKRTKKIAPLDIAKMKRDFVRSQEIKLIQEPLESKRSGSEGERGEKKRPGDLSVADNHVYSTQNGRSECSALNRGRGSK